MTYPKPYIAVVTDMDGTALQPDHTASAETKAVVRCLSESRGVPVIFATGRHHVDVLATKRKLGLSGYVVTSNGARVHDNAGVAIIKNDLPADLARRLALIAMEDSEIVTSIYQEDLWLISREAKDVTEYYQDNKDVFFYRVFDPRAHASYEGVYKVYYTSDNLDKLHELEKKIATVFAPGEVYAAYSLPFCLEVTRGHVNKAVAVGQLLDEYLFPSSDLAHTLSAQERRDRLLSQCIFFGDGQNDAEMLTCGGTGCVMGNAQDALRAKVDTFLRAHPERAHCIEHVKANTENGVAEKLKEVFQLAEEELAQARS